MGLSVFVVPGGKTIDAAYANFLDAVHGLAELKVMGAESPVGLAAGCRWTTVGELRAAGWQICIDPQTTGSWALGEGSGGLVLHALVLPADVLPPRIPIDLINLLTRAVAAPCNTWNRGEIVSLVGSSSDAGGSDSPSAGSSSSSPSTQSRTGGGGGAQASLHVGGAGRVAGGGGGATESDVCSGDVCGGAAPISTHLAPLPHATSTWHVGDGVAMHSPLPGVPSLLLPPQSQVRLGSTATRPLIRPTARHVDAASSTSSSLSSTPLSTLPSSPSPSRSSDAVRNFTVLFGSSPADAAPVTAERAADGLVVKGSGGGCSSSSVDAGCIDEALAVSAFALARGTFSTVRLGAH